MATIYLLQLYNLIHQNPNPKAHSTKWDNRNPFSQPESINELFVRFFFCNFRPAFVTLSCPRQILFVIFKYLATNTRKQNHFTCFLFGLKPKKKKLFQLKEVSVLNQIVFMSIEKQLKKYFLFPI